MDSVAMSFPCNNFPNQGEDLFINFTAIALANRGALLGAQRYCHADCLNPKSKIE
jgi:hypothetical protein